MKLMGLLLIASNVYPHLIHGVASLPIFMQSSINGGFNLEGQGPETVWDANLQPLTVDPTGALR